jgi:hypothetical protein
MVQWKGAKLLAGNVEAGDLVSAGIGEPEVAVPSLEEKRRTRTRGQLVYIELEEPAFDSQRR